MAEASASREGVRNRGGGVASTSLCVHTGMWAGRSLSATARGPYRTRDRHTHQSDRAHRRGVVLGLLDRVAGPKMASSNRSAVGQATAELWSHDVPCLWT